MRNHWAKSCAVSGVVIAQIRAVSLTAQEEALCEAIKAAIKMAKPKQTITGLARKIGTTYDKLSNVVHRRTAPRPELVDDIRSALSLPSHWPDSEVNRTLHKGFFVDIEGEPTIEIDIVGNVAAGREIYNVDPERRKVRIPAEMAVVADTAFIIDGDSMMPHLQEDDCACFKQRSKPKHGLVFLIQTVESGLLVKVLWFDRGEWYLRSYNGAHRPFKMPDGARLCGFLVGWYRKTGKRKQMDFNPDGLTYDFDRSFSEEFTQIMRT